MTDSLNVQIAKRLGWTNIRVEDGVLVGYSQTERENGLIPDYAHSLDACAAALPDDALISFNRISGRHDAEIDDGMGEEHGQGATRAEALARALLAWLTAQEVADGSSRL